MNGENWPDDEAQNTAEPRGVWAVVPMKSLAQSKSRLSAALSPEERVALSKDMLSRVVAALRGCPVLGGWMVVSSDVVVLAMAAAEGGYPLLDTEQDLNGSLRQAADEAISLGGEAILVLPGDVPLLSSDDIGAIVATAREERCVVIAPSRRHDGTNALLLRPPGIIPFSFGPGSLEAHIAAVQRAGAALHIYTDDRVAFDVDTEDDWRELVMRLSPQPSPRGA